MVWLACDFTVLAPKVPLSPRTSSLGRSVTLISRVYPASVVDATVCHEMRKCFLCTFTASQAVPTEAHTPLRTRLLHPCLAPGTVSPPTPESIEVPPPGCPRLLMEALGPHLLPGPSLLPSSQTFSAPAPWPLLPAGLSPQALIQGDVESHSERSPCTQVGLQKCLRSVHSGGWWRRQCLVLRSPKGQTAVLGQGLPFPGLSSSRDQTCTGLPEPEVRARLDLFSEPLDA